MATITQRVSDRFKEAIPKFQKVLSAAHARDINEADTVTIVTDILVDVFGFDKYAEVTGEYAIRNTYCDLAVKLDGKVQYLIEVKAIGLDLKENHLRQALDYGANEGIQWVVLTNGISWEIYRILFEKPVGCEKVCSINMLEMAARKIEDQEKLFILTREGISKSAREDYLDRVQIVNRYVIAAVLLDEDFVDEIRRELRRLSYGLKVENDEIENILRNEIIKRDVLEGDDAQRAKARVKRAVRAQKKEQSPQAEAGSAKPPQTESK